MPPAEDAPRCDAPVMVVAEPSVPSALHWIVEAVESESHDVHIGEQIGDADRAARDGKDGRSVREKRSAGTVVWP
jgi:hypothetical protein